MKMYILTLCFLSYSTIWAQDQLPFAYSDNQQSEAVLEVTKPIQTVWNNHTKVAASQTAIIAYPNPTKQKVTLFIEKEFSSIHLKVIDGKGKTMLIDLEVEGKYYTFDWLNLAVGTYYFLITIDGQTEVLSMEKN
ncbi:MULTISPECIES: T9SS type A sorting domain-containing protein [unclassified Aureispira]|uniref:T9SS type A sorting domain-containing protein n=1 Tax=unclassified Aureispira TaxID=2649989 RepID=UPI0012DEE3E9|nr:MULTISPECIES: T9SS type A sorting domain-containing protein [unclassified Aureispira]WMX16185.1 T9SS type A sorting domain-containing protein [Aureispira sp. CCB-E]